MATIPNIKKSILNSTVGNASAKKTNSPKTQKQGNMHFQAFGVSSIVCGNSSWLLSVSYHTETKTLDIKTLANGASYTYAGVSNDMWLGLLETSNNNGSLGAYINRYIKPQHKLISTAI